MIVKLHNGYLKVDTPEAEELLEDLLDRDELWEYLSIAFQKSVEEEMRKRKEGEQMNSLLTLLQKVSSKVDTLEKTVKEVPKVAVPVSGNSTATPSKPVEEPVRKPRERKKVDMNKLNALGGNANPFLAAASRAKKFK